MGLGVGIFLIAVGAILTFAINADTNGAVNIDTVGWILMAVGLASVLLSMICWSSWAGPGYWSRRRTYGDDGPPAERPPYYDPTRGGSGRPAVNRYALEFAVGSSTVNSEPRRPSDSTQIRPFMRWTSSRQM